MDTRENVLSVIADQIGVDVETLKDTTELVKDLKVDELDYIEIVMVLEETFGIDIPNDDCYGFAWESFVYSQTQDGRNDTIKLPTGTYAVRVALKGVGVDKSFLFTLVNPGKDATMRLFEQNSKHVHTA